MLELNKIYYQDCLEGMKLIDDKSVDMILCDLPFGSTKCNWDVIIDFHLLWEQYNRIIKDSGPILLFGSEPFSSYLRISNIKNYKYDWIWNKVTAKGHLVAKKRPMQQTENISVFYKNAPNYQPIMILRDKERKDVSMEYSRTEIMGGETTKPQEKIVRKYLYPKTILTFSNASQKNKLHPTQKPIELCEYLIKTYTNENDLILDNCIGSGTTALACKNLKRNFIGFENNEEYYKIACNRIGQVV